MEHQWFKYSESVERICPKGHTKDNCWLLDEECLVLKFQDPLFIIPGDFLKEFNFEQRVLTVLIHSQLKFLSGLLEECLCGYVLVFAPHGVNLPQPLHHCSKTD